MRRRIAKTLKIAWMKHFLKKRDEIGNKNAFLGVAKKFYEKTFSPLAFTIAKICFFFLFFCELVGIFIYWVLFFLK